MANDILSINGNTSGSQSIGKVTVATGGRGSQALFRKSYSPENVKEITISSIAAKYDARFDEPRYYTGDSGNA